MYRKRPIKATNRPICDNKVCKIEVFEKAGTRGTPGTTPWLSTFYEHIEGKPQPRGQKCPSVSGTSNEVTTQPKRVLQLCRCGQPVNLYRSLDELFDGTTKGKTTNKLCPHCEGKRANQRATEKR